MSYNIKFPTQEELLALGLAELSNETDRSENSFAHQILSAASIMLHELVIHADYVERRQHVDNLFGSELDEFIYDRTGLRRKNATVAVGQATFAGTKGTYIPIGTLITDGHVQFKTTYGDKIGEQGTVTIDICATVGGDVGYFGIGSLNKLVETVNGITSVTNETEIKNGYNMESDFNFRARYKDYFRDYPTTNNPSQFRHWAMAVNGVGQARIKRAFNGAGTIKIIVLDSKYQAASEELLQKVKAYIEDKHGFDVKELSVVAPQVVKINIEAELLLGDGYSDEAVKKEIADALRKHLTTYMDPMYIMPQVGYWDVATLVKQTAGVKDITRLTINGGQSNIMLTDEQVAEVGIIV